MKKHVSIPLLGLFCGVALSSSAASSSLLGWNNLGMHCMDRDFSVFSILPPYNTIEAQLIVNGSLVESGTGYTVTYEAVADPDGSINTTSIGKGNFYDFTAAMYGPLAPDAGLVGWGMPGPQNTPRQMLFEVTNSPAAGVKTRVNWFRAEGIPITPYDDAGKDNPYPLMRLVARNSSGAVIASSDIVLPVSDEMDCRLCHASGSTSGAKPLSGWVNNPNAELDYRLNIVRLHDDVEFAVHNSEYTAALAARGFNPSGLYANVVNNGKPVLCAACHASEALQAPSYGNIPALTTSIHGWHAHVQDPVTNMTLDSSANRSSCYRCHPGSSTKCLRGAMGSAVAADGSMEMQCQSCHGTLSQVGSPNRIGWFMEPNCQACHTGTATHNNGQIRYTSVFDATGAVRTAVDQTFATTPNTPAAGLSLYRFSAGHGGLQCSACHGSTHAEFPTSERNDNIRNVQLQGHAGVMIECTACHATMPATITGGPHGMHPIGQDWVNTHNNAVSSVGRAACQACHGTDFRGTVLSRVQGTRVLSALGTQNFFRGATVGCYTCHDGPYSSTPSPDVAPTVSNVSARTSVGASVQIALPVSGTGFTVRIISQPANGTVGLSGTTATYFPDAAFTGTDTFTFAAYDGAKNSTLATGTITVGSGSGAVAPTITTQPQSQTVTAGANVTFSVVATGTAPLSYQWRKSGVNISGATASALTLTSVTSSSAGGYSVVVANSAGSVTSATATLTVNSTAVAPTITTQPQSQTVTAGANVTFSVGATGTAPLSYQWRKSGVNISGATASALRLTSVTSSSAGGYSVVVANSGGSVTSATATLTVRTPPFVQITAPADGSTFKSRSYITLSAEALDVDGTISSVVFYSGSTVLGTGTASSTLKGPNGGTIYSYLWRRVPSGTYTLTARATDNSGLSSTSAPVHITVGNGSTNLAGN